jgi:hypothetical protein
MSQRVKQFMRYWAFLVGKFAVAGAIFGSLVWLLNRFWEGPSVPVANKYHTLGYDRYLVYLICLGVVYLIGVGLFYLAILDQRYRCRVCLRRLRMPIETGSWGRMLQFGRPHIQYICVYGHGKLNIPELHLTGTDAPEWTQHEDYWAELCATGDRKDSGVE